ncbi:MAG: HlyD family type I secretion periplasmic adaptor subunit [Pseudomonadaceae bacterium]|nr:HlyD family type I secretion periplasmic adaptor subunit [Pseudomonadaceae bacterium]
MNAKKTPQQATPLAKKDNKQRFDLLDNKVAEKFGVRVARAEGEQLGVKVQKMLWQAMHHEMWDDGDFMDDVRQATLRGAHPLATFFFWALVAMLALFFIWASFASLDEVARGEGVVIPSGKVQAVGSPEGGVVAEIMVKAGDIVEAGQPLVRLDDTTALSGVGEKENRRAYLQANIAVLEALVEGTPLALDPSLTAMPDVVAEAEKLYANRKQALESTTGVLEQQVEQKKQELADARRKAGTTAQALGLAQKEYNMAKPYLAQGAISEADLLRLERQVVEARQENNTAQLAVPTAEAAMKEAESRLSEGVLQVTNEARDELAKMREEFGRLGEAVKADVGKVERTLLKSPIHAEVKQVLVNTVGQAVQPNANIVELVPLEETLLVEAQVKPQDIAFLRPGLPAMVKITAYDFGIYGGLDGKLETISPDSFTDEERKETFYKIQVRTDRNYLQRGKTVLPIKSGMVATVDVLTGKKTVMEYLLKPINKARERAFSER